MQYFVFSLGSIFFSFVFDTGDVRSVRQLGVGSARFHRRHSRNGKWDDFVPSLRESKGVMKTQFSKSNNITGSWGHCIYARTQPDAFLFVSDVWVGSIECIEWEVGSGKSEVLFSCMLCWMQSISECVWGLFICLYNNVYNVREAVPWQSLSILQSRFTSFKNINPRPHMLFSHPRTHMGGCNPPMPFRP